MQSDHRTNSNMITNTVNLYMTMVAIAFNKGMYTKSQNTSLANSDPHCLDAKFRFRHSYNQLTIKRLSQNDNATNSHLIMPL